MSIKLNKHFIRGKFIDGEFHAKISDIVEFVDDQSVKAAECPKESLCFARIARLIHSAIPA